MQKTFITLLIVSSGFVSAQEYIEIPSSVKSVTVYPRGAQVERATSKFLSTGRQLIKFTGLASELDASSISVSAGSDVSVLSVSSRVNHLKQSSIPKEVKLIKDSLETFEFDHAFNQNMLGVYQEERSMILANKQISGEESGFVIEDLEDLSDFYRDRLADVMLKRMELESKQKKLSEHINRLRRQLNEHNSRLNRSTGEILVEVQLAANKNVEFSFSYMVRSAGWMPTYNVQVADVDKPLGVEYNAKVYQNTGVDWEKVKIRLTNANPNLNGDKPQIHPWRLYFMQQTPAEAMMGYSNKRAEEMQVQTFATAADDMSSDAASATIEYPVNEAATQFEIKLSHTINSTGKSQVINIDEFKIPAKYEYYVAPKIDPTAFLIARVSGFEQYDLLPGQANLFLANTYVGQTMIDPKVVSDTLDLSLGRDQSIVVKREKIKESCVTKKIGNSTKEDLGIRISIRNTKSTKVQLVIEDQIPISSNREIEVDLIEQNGAKFNADTGVLRWTKMILANSAESVLFKYSVKYPSDKKINL